MAMFKRKSDEVGKSQPLKTVQARDEALEDAVFNSLLQSVDLSDRPGGQSQTAPIQTVPSKIAESQAAQPDPAPRKTDISGTLGNFDFTSPEFSERETEDIQVNLPKETKEQDITSAVASPTLKPAPSVIETFDSVIATPEDHVATRKGHADIGEMRADLSRLKSDLAESEKIQRQAQIHIQNINQFAERAEVDLTALSRIAPENRRLKSRNETLLSEISKKDAKIEALESELAEYKDQLAERENISERVETRLEQATKALQKYQRVLKQAQSEADNRQLRLDRSEAAQNAAKHENDVLRDKLAEVLTFIDRRTMETIEAKKIAESLREDCSDYRSEAGRAIAETVRLKNTLEETKAENDELKKKISTLTEDVRNFKSRHEATASAREDQISSLETELNSLTRKLEIKEDFVKSMTEEVANLRQNRDLAVNAQNTKIEDEVTLALSKNEKAVEQKYKKVTSALAKVQKKPAANLVKPAKQEKTVEKSEPKDNKASSPKKDKKKKGLSLLSKKTTG